uniref:VRR-NUC domain-containing protein n=1 Tax=viral metagenome TaxID=1070528 RepID=A0A6M3XS64_9ZZZZ
MKESELKHAVEEYLQFQQNLGRLLFLRLNAGDFIEARGETRRRIKGCPKGTADLLVLQGYESASPEECCDSCVPIFLELKSDTGKQRPEQLDFQGMVEEQNAEYHIVRSVEEVMELVGGKA